MAALVRKYRIGKNRLKQGLMSGFVLEEDGSLKTKEEEPLHQLYLGYLDGVERDYEWGRFVFDAEIGENMVLNVHIFASNDLVFMRKGVLTEIESFLLDESEPPEAKLALFKAANCRSSNGFVDILMTGLSGRYLWVMIEILGAGRASLRNFCAYSPEDNFFNSFPEIYRTNGEFFRRYLAVFNALYTDFQSTIDSLDQYIDIDTAPAGLLPVFARWIGLELDGGFLEEEQLRRLLKIAYPLISSKGTCQAVIKIAHILTDAPVYILERQASYRGVREDPYDFTVLILCAADKKLYSSLKYLIGLFKPVRSKMNFVFLDSCGRLDSYCCLGMNAKIVEPVPGVTDCGMMLDGLSYLQ